MFYMFNENIQIYMKSNNLISIILKLDICLNFVDIQFIMVNYWTIVVI